MQKLTASFSTFEVDLNLGLGMKEKILDHFNKNHLPFYEKYLLNLKHLKEDEYQTLCCFHDDTNPSLSINANTGQFYCHGCKAKGDIFKFYGLQNGLNGDFSAVLNGIAKDFGIAQPLTNQQIKRYVYKDADGNPIHSTIRTAAKDFYQEKYEDGRWVKGLKDVRLVLYRLPQVLKADEVLFVEGEKDADNLENRGFTATTSPMGAGKWRKNYNQYLEGKRVVLIPDNDDVGQKHMQQVAESLKGTASSIKIIELPELKEKQDVSDFLSKFNDPDEAAESLSILIENTPKYEPPETSESPCFENGIITFQDFVKMDLPEKRMILNPWITEQSICLISGWRNTGKTWLMLSILDAISKNKKFGDWDTINPVSSLYLDGEMPQQDMQHRAKELNINCNCISPIYLYSDAYRAGLGMPRANLLDEHWRKQMAKFLLGKDIKLWVVDNIASLAPGIDENSKKDWDPINKWLLELRFQGIASILLHHVGKGGSQRGTSAREDNIDTSVYLKHPADYQTEDGCRFIMEFKKNRVVSGDQVLLANLEFQYNAGQWEFEDSKSKSKTLILQMLQEGVKGKDIATELGVSPAYVSKIKRINRG